MEPTRHQSRVIGHHLAQGGEIPTSSYGEMSSDGKTDWRTDWQKQDILIYLLHTRFRLLWCHIQSIVLWMFWYAVYVYGWKADDIKYRFLQKMSFQVVNLGMKVILNAKISILEIPSYVEKLLVMQKERSANHTSRINCILLFKTDLLVTSIAILNLICGFSQNLRIVAELYVFIQM